MECAAHETAWGEDGGERSERSGKGEFHFPRLAKKIAGREVDPGLKAGLDWSEMMGAIAGYAESDPATDGPCE